MDYLHELPIGTRFQIPFHRGVNILTHKLGENGYKETTYPFRYRDQLGIELTSITNLEVNPLPKKGDTFTEETVIPGRISISTCIGFVVGIEYNSEGNIMEWLLNKKCELKKFDERPKIFDTPEQAEKFIKKTRPKFLQYMYYRPYFYTKYSKK